MRDVTEKLLTYALGRGLEYYDMPIVRGIVDATARDGYKFSSRGLRNRRERAVPRAGRAAACAGRGSSRAARFRRHGERHRAPELTRES